MNGEKTHFVGWSWKYWEFTKKQVRGIWFDTCRDPSNCPAFCCSIGPESSCFRQWNLRWRGPEQWLAMEGDQLNQKSYEIMKKKKLKPESPDVGSWFSHYGQLNIVKPEQLLSFLVGSKCVQKCGPAADSQCNCEMSRGDYHILTIINHILTIINHHSPYINHILTRGFTPSREGPVIPIEFFSFKVRSCQPQSDRGPGRPTPMRRRRTSRKWTLVTKSSCQSNICLTSPTRLKRKHHGTRTSPEWMNGWMSSGWWFGAFIYFFPYIYIYTHIYIYIYIYTLGMSSSQLLLTPSFFRGVGLNHQAVIINHH